jgi:hypothetical protein
MADRHDNSITCAFRAHLELPEPVAVMLEYVWQEARDRGDIAKAAALERLAVRDDAAVAYWREFQTRERGRDNPRRGELEHPTVIAGLWRNQHTQQDLLTKLRENPQRVAIKSLLQLAVDDEYKARQIFFVILLDRLAELATTDERANRTGRAEQDERSPPSRSSGPPR